eukprot:2776998-Rhodomonas_salina.1
MRCPVLTSAMLLRGGHEDLARVDSRNGHQGSDSRISLRACYAMSGSDMEYGPTQPTGHYHLRVSAAICLRGCYAMSGTEMHMVLPVLQYRLASPE